MTTKHTETPTVQRHAVRRRATATGRTAAVAQCLVLSAAADRRSMLNSAAIDAGWQTIVCADAVAARIAAGRQRLGLALVDLESIAGDVMRDVRGFVEELSTVHDVLLALCGNLKSPSEETWARQLGTWLYLPGVTCADDLSIVCSHARETSEKMASAEKPLAARPPQ